MQAYMTTDNIADTIEWLLGHQDCFDSFQYDAIKEELTVTHAAGTDVIRIGIYLNAEHGILVTS